MADSDKASTVVDSAQGNNSTAQSVRKDNISRSRSPSPEQVVVAESTPVDLEKGGSNGATNVDMEEVAISENSAPEKVTTDPNIVDWDGPDDPMNPLNWSFKKKFTIVASIAFITFLTPLGSSMFAPGVADVMREFESTNELLASFVVSVYLLGYAAGPMILAPLSELYGRAIIYHTCNWLFVIFNIACAVANSLDALIVFRFFAGCAGSAPLTIGAGSLADMIRQEKRGAAMAAWALGPLLGPVAGPVAGGYLTQAKGWRWTFWIIAIFAGAVAVNSLLFMTESYAPVLLERKAKKLRKETGNPNLRSKLDTGRQPKELFMFSIVRPMKMLFQSPIVFLLSLYIAVVYGYLYLLFTTISVVFEGQYHFSQGNVGLAFLGIGIGNVVGLGLLALISDRLLLKLAARNGGEKKPEYRLPPMIPGALLIPAGLFWYGWTAEKHVQYVAPIAGTLLVGIGMIFAFMTISTYLVDAFTIHAASAMAANTVLRSIAGALLPLCGMKMYDALGLGWGNSLLAFIALAMVPLPVIFFKYGERIRTSPRFRVNL